MYLFKNKINWQWKGSGGGGGTSGKVDYPEYMKTAHGDWLDDDGVDTLDNSVVDLMNTAMGGSPYTGENAYDPDTDIAVFIGDVTNLRTVAAALDPEVDWVSYATTARTEIDTNIISDVSIDAEIAAHDAIIDDRLTTDILPRFQAGMRDINSVVSTSFVIGQSNIEGFAQRDKDKFATDIRLKAYGQRNEMIMASIESLSRLTNLQLEFLKIVANVSTDARRAKIVAKGEELQSNLEIDSKDATWDLEMLKYGTNVLSGIAGTATSQGTEGPSKFQSALGGALSGAAAGAMVGGPIGAGIGAGLGAAASLF